MLAQQNEPWVKVEVIAFEIGAVLPGLIASLLMVGDAITLQVSWES